MQENNFIQSLGPLPILGVVHMAGSTMSARINRALNELETYQEQGLQGAIIQNLEGSLHDVDAVLQKLQGHSFDMALGVNSMHNSYGLAYKRAEEHNLDFVYAELVAGKYHGIHCYDSDLLAHRDHFDDIPLLGGVWPRLQIPLQGSNYQQDVQEAVDRCDGLVISKIPDHTLPQTVRFARRQADKHPLFLDDQLTLDEAYPALTIADGALIGRAFKLNGETHRKIDEKKVKDMMHIVGEAREYKETLTYAL